MIRPHTPYDKPRGVAGKRRERTYYSNWNPNGHDQPKPYPAVPDPQEWAERQQKSNRKR